MSHYFSKKKLAQKKRKFPRKADPGTVNPDNIGDFFSDPSQGGTDDVITATGPAPSPLPSMVSPDIIASIGNVQTFDLQTFNPQSMSVIELTRQSVVVTVGRGLRELPLIRLEAGEGAVVLFNDVSGRPAASLIVQGNLSLNHRLRRVILNTGEFVAVIRSQRSS
ncbi:hypothetical protein [Mechercharimyces sp. CAU 1602]|uniref:hypothetical protein n=1 Tax=Mechercharimyces sp. CAU 1602 TaxID=2973933 RepID=UPI0021612D04|nr:hypothetical protein [Mechercharimyces sp. CAU 1602]MCS1351058.1 hypothetical protein [Mechercharimyces sp. CAU 1602]